MPTTIIIRITDEDCAKSCLAAGAKDLAESFLPDAYIHASKVTVIYRTPEDERKATAGELDYKERRSQWPNDPSSVTRPTMTTDCNESGMAGIGAAHGPAPVISIFVTFPTEPEWERRHERCKTRKEAAACIRAARAKGGFDINVFDPWTKRREAQNAKSSATPGQQL